MKNDHFVPAVAEMLEPGQHRVHVVEQVAEDHHHAALFEPFGQIVKDRAGVRLALRHALLHDVQQLLQVRRIAAGADQRPDLLVERDHAHAVLLLKHQVGQRAGDALGIFELGHRRLGTAVTHALAGVDEQVTDEVRLLFVLLQVELIGLAVNLPVDVAQIVALRVLAMFGKLDRKAVVRAAMHARDVAFHDQPGSQLQALELSQRLRI